MYIETVAVGASFESCCTVTKSSSARPLGNLAMPTRWERSTGVASAATGQDASRGPTTYQVSIAPLPLTSTVPRGVQTNSSFSRSYVARVIWNSPGEPWLSIRLAVLTASPHRSYRNRFDPMTPATTGPELMPIRSSRPSPSTTGEPATVSRMSSASDAARRA